VIARFLPAILGRDFRWLWSSAAVTNLGDGLLLAAGPLLVTTLTREPLAVAMAVFLQQLPWVLLGIPAGAIIDRVDRHRLTIGVNLGRAVVLGLLATTVATGTVSLPIIFVATFLIGTAETFADNAASALVATRVPREHLGIANARLTGTAIMTNQLAGPPIGALLFGLGMAIPFGVDAIAALSGAVLIARMADRPWSAREDPPRHIRHEIAEGFSWLWHHPPVRILALTIFFFNVTFWAAISVYVLLAKERLGLDDFGYGLLITVGGHRRVDRFGGVWPVGAPLRPGHADARGAAAGNGDPSGPGGHDLGARGGGDDDPVRDPLGRVGHDVHCRSPARGPLGAPRAGHERVHARQRRRRRDRVVDRWADRAAVRHHGAVLVRVLRVSTVARADLARPGQDRARAGSRGLRTGRVTAPDARESTACDNRATMSEELRPSEVARRTGASIRTVQRWIATGQLPARRVGGRWLVAFDAFGAFSPAATLPGPAARAESTPFPARPIRRLFIANRGEIATRIARTADRLGMTPIAAATDGREALDLLDMDAVVAAARATNADAIHPGFGFLAENAAFAEAVTAAGITWVGPPPGAIRAMGDKAAARRLAASLEIPTIAGYDDADQSDEALTTAAQWIGTPLLIKPAAGGGGKGMRTVRDPGRLSAELAAARREARTAFGDDRLILERLIEGARHVEIQVLFDRAGSGAHLGERDCSVQRRHQKVLEEAGSPAVDGALRERMGEAALTLVRAVDYEGAGTCEFLLDDRGDFTFLEMNTRLQVEHPVTELITGRDLVADQLRIAAGEPLGLAQDDVAFDGHAIEVRLYAEDAEAGFLPATGRVERLRWPAGDGIRVDAGIAEGNEVTGRFDPMLAKIIAHGRDRGDALDRLTAALDSTVVLGLTTNLRFLRWLVREPVVRDGEVRTNTLDRIWPPDDWMARTAVPEAAWSAAASALIETSDAREADPWAGGWRLNGPPSARVLAEDEVRQVTVGPLAGPTTFDFVRVGDTVHLDLAGRSTPFRLAPPPDVDRAARAAARSGSTGPIDLVAPMPGRVLTIHVPRGAPVAAGDPVVTLEAMKMEHAVTAPRDGVVGEIAVQIADQVIRGQTLAVIDGTP